MRYGTWLKENVPRHVAVNIAFRKGGLVCALSRWKHEKSFHFSNHSLCQWSQTFF